MFWSCELPAGLVPSTRGCWCSTLGSPAALSLGEDREHNTDIKSDCERLLRAYSTFLPWCGSLSASCLTDLTWLPPGYDYHVCWVEERPTLLDHSAVCAKLRLPLRTREEMTEWVMKTRSTPVTWRVLFTKPLKGQRVIVKYQYRCQHCVHSRSDTADKRKTSKNTRCPARLQITLKREKRANGKELQSKDSHLPRYPTEVVLRNTHNHNLYQAEALKHRDVGPKAVQSLTRLFQAGHSTASAMAALQEDLKAEYGDRYVYACADRALSPDLSFCKSLRAKIMGITRRRRPASAQPGRQRKRKKAACLDVLHCETAEQDQTGNLMQGQRWEQNPSQGESRTSPEAVEAERVAASCLSVLSDHDYPGCPQQNPHQADLTTNQEEREADLTTNQEEREDDSAADFLCLSVPSDHEEDRAEDPVGSMIRALGSLSREPVYSQAMAAMAQHFHHVRTNPTRLLAAMRRFAAVRPVTTRPAATRPETTRPAASRPGPLSLCRPTPHPRPVTKRSSKRRVSSGRLQTHCRPVDRQEMMEHHRSAFSVENNESVKRQRMMEHHKSVFSLERNGTRPK